MPAVLELAEDPAPPMELLAVDLVACHQGRQPDARHWCRPATGAWQVLLGGCPQPQQHVAARQSGLVEHLC